MLQAALGRGGGSCSHRTSATSGPSPVAAHLHALKARCPLDARRPRCSLQHPLQRGVALPELQRRWRLGPLRAPPCSSGVGQGASGRQLGTAQCCRHFAFLGQPACQAPQFVTVTVDGGFLTPSTNELMDGCAEYRSHTPGRVLWHRRQLARLRLRQAGIAELLAEHDDSFRVQPTQNSGPDCRGDFSYRSLRPIVGATRIRTGRGGVAGCAAWTNSALAILGATSGYARVFPLWPTLVRFVALHR